MKKKLIGILAVLGLASFSLVACGEGDTETDETSETEDVVDSAEVEETENTEEDYEKVFDYLPELTEDAELDESEEPSEDNAGMGKEVYTIKDTDAEDVMDDYFEMLEEDDWEIVEDNRPDLVKATKDEHEVIVVAGQVEEDVKLTIVSK